MIHSVTSWTATVQSALDKSNPLYEGEWAGQSLQVHATGDSIFLALLMPNKARMAFRLAYAMGGRFEEVKIKMTERGILVTADTEIGCFRTVLAFYEETEPVLRYTTTFLSKHPLLIPFAPRDIIPLTMDGKTGNTTATLHSHQVGSRAGHLFLSTTSPKENTLLYLQNLTALSEYCEDTKTSIAETVGGTWPEIGFQLPIATETPLQAGKEYCLSDALVLLSADVPQDEFEVAQQFINHLGTLYTLLPRPETRYSDWLDISEKSLSDLENNKGAWMYSGGHPYLNAYLCDYKTPPEIMVQLAVLYAVWEYDQWTGKKLAIVEEIKGGLPAFYDEKLGTISRWLPSLRDNLDQSEEQKAPMVMDSWYLHHPLMNLAKLALAGHKLTEKLLLDSVGYAIKIAHHFNYSWPVFYKMDTLEVIKEETAPGMGGEKDVAGSYAYLMLLTYDLTGDRRYLREAEKAAKKLQGLGMTLFYQANNTAFSALAMLQLYGITQNELYLKLSYLCLAGIFKNVQLSESNYGNSKHFPTFLGVFPLNDAPYKAAYEEMEVCMALNDYCKEAAKIKAPIPNALKMLLPEFVRYSINRLPYFYPPNLPAAILSKEIKTGELDPKLWIPIEDLYDGWDLNGQVGQEVYGAGVGFGVVPRQYIQLEEKGVLLYTDYPIINFRKAKNSATFRILGTSDMKCRILIIAPTKTALKKYSLCSKSGSKYEKQPQSDSNEHKEFIISGGTAVKIEW